MPQEGDVALNRRDGSRAVFRGGQWVRDAAGGQVGDASIRGRMALGLGPMVQAEQNLSAMERGGNPLQKDWLATTMDNVGVPLPFGGGEWKPLSDAAKFVGGDDYQRYQQAASAFESQLMPIMSGAAVSPSEAQRQIRASLPELGDSPETLRQKARQRQMMLNGAAKIMGAQLPYPDVPTYGINSQQVPAATAGGPKRLRYNPQTGKLQ